MNLLPHWHRIAAIGLAGLLTVSLSACVTHHPVKSSFPEKKERIYPQAPHRQEGSVWKGDSFDNVLFSDAKARNVGDIVTIVVEENTSSSQTATTQTSRQTDMNLQTGKLLGLPSNLGIQNFLGLGNGFNPNLDAKTDKSFDGSGSTTRNGTLTSTITAVIKEVLPDDNFVIEGRRSVTINNEEQIMILTGVIRYQDIGFDNSVSSRLIADASITYSGTGVVADEQRVGWGTRLISWIWPF
ncbi:MAG: flagellar basal body L-ring protein FlgH [Nitrospinales bacterium]